MAAELEVYVWSEWIDKPHSVADNHLSWLLIAQQLFAPNLELGEQRQRSGSGLLRVEFGLFTPCTLLAEGRDSSLCH